MVKVRHVQFRQETSRHWSQWLTVGTRESCCDCGMVHQVQYALSDKVGPTDRKLWKRVRVHHAATKARRKEKKFRCR